jgi:hypothetical protein
MLKPGIPTFAAGRTGFVGFSAQTVQTTLGMHRRLGASDGPTRSSRLGGDPAFGGEQGRRAAGNGLASLALTSALVNVVLKPL